jgi:hypothetical protein
VGSQDSLLLEYGRSSEFCNHVDDVRNVITSFFLTVIAGAALVLREYSDGSLKAGKLGSPALLTAAVLFSVVIVGTIFTWTLARLRRVQLERHIIMDRILDECLAPNHRKLVPFSAANVPTRVTTSALTRRTNGSYVWSLAIVIPTAALLGLGVFVILSDPLTLAVPFALSVAAGSSILYLLTLDRAYCSLSQP